MIQLLDTCICIELIRRKNLLVRNRFDEFEVGQLGISSITEGELRVGAEKSSDPLKNHGQLDRMFSVLPVVDFGRSAAREYGKVRSYLELRGYPIGSNDTLIAAHALSIKLPLVTNNVREFSRVPGLAFESW